VLRNRKLCLDPALRHSINQWADATTEVMWVQTDLDELGIRTPHSARLWCDNMGVKYLVSNPIFYGRMKHVKIDYHFV
jgi:hypothetical protein